MWSVHSAAKVVRNVAQTKQARHDCSQLDAAIAKQFPAAQRGPFSY